VGAIEITFSFQLPYVWELILLFENLGIIFISYYLDDEEREAIQAGVGCDVGMKSSMKLI